MIGKFPVFACAASLLAGAALAQAPPPLNLTLPADAVPASSASTASGTTLAGTPAADPPGVYYGDTSGSMSQTADVDSARACDDSTYNQPQVHGSVGMGAMSGRHVGSGTFTTGSVRVSRQYGSCDEPGGGVSMSISVGDTHFHGRDRGH